MHVGFVLRIRVGQIVYARLGGGIRCLAQTRPVPAYMVVRVLSVFSAIFIVFLLVYFRWYQSNATGTSARATETQGATTETNNEAVEEGYGPATATEHFIWNIRTLGLEPSIISSIPVFKYKNDNGLVEGTDCSICLSDFEEDEDLRLLAKCSHAFHISCIDTWLGAHTNCPTCRALILANDGASSSTQANT